MVGSAASRALDRAGRDVTLTVYEKTGEDEYGENFSESPNTPATVKARVVRSSVTLERDARAASVDAPVEVFVKDDIPDVDLLKDGGGDGAADIQVDGETLVVALKDVQDNGLIRLVCRRET